MGDGERYVYVADEESDLGDTYVTGIYATLEAACLGPVERWRRLGDDLWVCANMQIRRWKVTGVGPTPPFGVAGCTCGEHPPRGLPSPHCPMHGGDRG